MSSDQANPSSGLAHSTMSMQGLPLHPTLSCPNPSGMARWDIADLARYVLKSSGLARTVRSTRPIRSPAPVRKKLPNPLTGNLTERCHSQSRFNNCGAGWNTPMCFTSSSHHRRTHRHISLHRSQSNAFSHFPSPIGFLSFWIRRLTLTHPFPSQQSLPRQFGGLNPAILIDPSPDDPSSPSIVLYSLRSHQTPLSRVSAHWFNVVRTPGTIWETHPFPITRSLITHLNSTLHHTSVYAQTPTLGLSV